MFFCDNCCGPNCYVPPYEGSSDFPQMIVEITGSTTHHDPGSEFDYGPYPGGCCPCVNGTWYMDYTSSCTWATAYQYDPFGTSGNTALPPGCTEPYPQFCESFGGSCSIANVGWVTLVMQIGRLFDRTIGIGLSVQNYHMQTGWGYVCTGQLSARAVLPAPPAGDYLNITDWVTMEGSDDRPYGPNRFCGWLEHEVDGDVFTPTVTIQFKAGT